MALRVIMDAHGLAVLLRRPASPDQPICVIAASTCAKLPRDLEAPDWKDFQAGLKPTDQIGVDSSEWPAAALRALRASLSPLRLVDMSRQIADQVADRSQ